MIAFFIFAHKLTTLNKNTHTLTTYCIHKQTTTQLIYANCNKNFNNPI